MVSRLGFAVAAAWENPGILILDEVLSVGDVFFKEKSTARIRELMKKGRAVLIVSHSTDTILRNCTRALWIEKGVQKLTAVLRSLPGLSGLWKKTGCGWMKTKIYKLLVNGCRQSGENTGSQKRSRFQKRPGSPSGKTPSLESGILSPGRQDRRRGTFLSGKEKLLFQESGSFSGMSGEILFEQLSGYDVISFDVFDTLLLRPFSAPTDLFYLMGIEFHYPDFPVLRILAEDQARQKKRKAEGTGEVTLKEIWKCLEPLTGIPAMTGTAMEISMEEKYCLGNPYFLPLVKALKKEGKILLAVSDMYLDRAFIQRLLVKYYGPVFDWILVSGEEGCSKGEGSLYEKVRDIGVKLMTAKGSLPGGSCSIAHVGDNPHSDILMARKNKIEPFLYPNPRKPEISGGHLKCPGSPEGFTGDW